MSRHKAMQRPPVQRALRVQLLRKRDIYVPFAWAAAPVHIQRGHGGLRATVGAGHCRGNFTDFDAHLIDGEAKSASMPCTSGRVSGAPMACLRGRKIKTQRRSAVRK